MNAFALREGCNVPVIERIQLGLVRECKVSRAPSPAALAFAVPEISTIPPVGCAQIKVNTAIVQGSGPVGSFTSTQDTQNGDQCYPILNFNINAPCPPQNVTGTVETGATAPAIEVTKTGGASACDHSFNIKLSIPDYLTALSLPDIIAGGLDIDVDGCVVTFKSSSSSFSDGDIVGIYGYDKAGKYYNGRVPTDDDKCNFGIAVGNTTAGSKGKVRICGLVEGVTVDVGNGAGFYYAQAIPGNKAGLKAAAIGGGRSTTKDALTGGSSKLWLDPKGPSSTMSNAGDTYTIDRYFASGRLLVWDPRTNRPADWFKYTRVKLVEPKLMFEDGKVFIAQSIVTYDAASCPVIDAWMTTDVETVTC